MTGRTMHVGHVWIDGKDVSSAIIRPGNYGPVSRSGVKLKNGNLRPFTFAKLNLTGTRFSDALFALSSTFVVY